MMLVREDEGTKKLALQAENLTPRSIVKELDRYIIGQNEAKRAVAIALRNRWRRKKVKDDIMREEILPNNIIMIGPTGVGKTEIARRLAQLTGAPFVKVEASKYTEVGYVGRDVESIIRDLVQLAVNAVKEEQYGIYREKAAQVAEEKILDILLPPQKPNDDPEQDASYNRTREKLRQQLHDGYLDNRPIELNIPKPNTPMIEIMGGQGLDEIEANIQNMMERFSPKRPKKRKLNIRDAKPALIDEEVEKLIDMDDVTREAINRVENAGIVFIDEIDKIAGVKSMHGPDVSREGVQRDLLPIVEGTRVQTKYGSVKTDHVLFIAAGAFNVSRPSDLIPELQGRFPIRVELKSLTADDFCRILVEPEGAFTKQYQSLISSEGIKLEFTKEAISEIAKIAAHLNDTMENIGARRLQTVLAYLLDEILFEAPENIAKHVIVDEEKVKATLSDISKDEDLSKYIL
jgi:ATP-dependent HslUV protease ATP-binding subunit HslU